MGWKAIGRVIVPQIRRGPQGTPASPFNYYQIAETLTLSPSALVLCVDRNEQREQLLKDLHILHGKESYPKTWLMRITLSSTRPTVRIILLSAVCPKRR